MQNNYYVLRKLSSQLRSKIIGFKVGEIYSQQKNELSICLYNQGDEFNIKAYLQSDFSCLYFPDSTNRAKRNSIDLFRHIYDLEIVDVVQIKQDRSFYFQLQNNFKLLFKMHGNRSNIVLIRNRQITEIFKNNLKQDFELDISSLPKSVNTSFENFKLKNGNYKLVMPTFGKDFDFYFQQKEYEKLPIENQYEAFTELLNYLENPKYFIHIKEERKPLLSLYQIDQCDNVFSDPIKALNLLFKSYISDYQLQKEKAKIRNSITREIEKCNSYISNSNAKLEKLKSAQSYAHIGDIIMANLHKIKKHETAISLTDFYTNQPITIQLKATLSPQHNAEKYYKKAKNQKIELQNLRENIELKRQEIATLEANLKKLEEATKVKDLRKEQHIPIKNADQPFHLVSYLGYEILIGKNARRNEQLTFDIAKKDDMFLHAKDKPGSHVIIRSKKGIIYPSTVIEKAASYAAFYSKSRNESLIRVLYTPKKYVRKAKNSPQGTVVVTQEKVLLVKPESIKK